jgi:hypothetical protein
MSLPVIRGSIQGTYPLRMTISFMTGLGQFQNGAQQRWISRPGALIKATLNYGGMNLVQKNTVRAAVSSAQGKLSQSLSLSLPFAGGFTAFSNFGIDNDEWVATESSSMLYDGPLELTQSVSQSLSPGTPGQPFPTLANGAISTLPYSQKKRYQTVGRRVPAGPSYNYAEFGSGLTGYPNDGLMAWTFDMQHVSDADVQTLVAHFVANFGKAYGFQYADESSGSSLSSLVNSYTTTIPLSADPGFALGQVFSLGTEQLSVTAGFAAGSLTASRGFNSTTAAGHAAATMSYPVYLKTHYAIDDLVITFNGPNDSALKIELEATN